MSNLSSICKPQKLHAHGEDGRKTVHHELLVCWLGIALMRIATVPPQTNDNLLGKDGFIFITIDK